MKAAFGWASSEPGAEAGVASRKAPAWPRLLQDWRSPCQAWPLHRAWGGWEGVSSGLW